MNPVGCPESEQFLKQLFELSLELKSINGENLGDEDKDVVVILEKYKDHMRLEFFANQYMYHILLTKAQSISTLVKANENNKKIGGGLPPHALDLFRAFIIRICENYTNAFYPAYRLRDFP